MRRVLPVILLTPLLLSMSEPASVPPEVKKLRAKVLDLKGVEHSLKEFSCGGESLEFRKGTLDYTVSLPSIERIEVLGENSGSVKVRVKLRSGKEEVFELPSSVRCTAYSELGSVSFYINEVKSIEIIKGEEK